MMRGLALGILLVPVFLACRPATTPPVEVVVGVHHVRLAIPTGWQHADHGREQRFERGFEQISLTA